MHAVGQSRRKENRENGCSRHRRFVIEHLAPFARKFLGSMHVDDIADKAQHQEPQDGVRPEKNKLHVKHVLLQSNARIGNRVGNIGQKQPQHVGGRPQKHHGADNGEILGIDGVNRVRSQPRNAEETFHDEASH